MQLSPRTFQCAALSLTLCTSSVVLAHVQGAVAPEAASLDEVLAAQSRARSVAQVAVSPDGKRIAWLEAGEIRVAPLDNFSQSKPVSAAEPGQICGASEFVWSPGSDAIAFLSDCDDPGEQTDIFLSHLDGNPPRRITTLHGYVDAPAFAPDSKSIAFLYVEGATRTPGALAAEIPPAGVIGEDRVEVQHVALVPACVTQPVAPVFVTPPNLHVFEFDWSPDSKALAYIAADPPGEDNWWVARLYTQPVGATSYAPAEQSGGGRVGLKWKPTPILNPPEVSGQLHGLQIAIPRWSPDGRSIAFIGGLMSDQGVTGGDVWVVPSTGGQPRDLTPDQPASAVSIEWGGNGHIYSSEIVDGNCEIVRINVWALLNQAAERGSHAHPAEMPIFNFPGSIADGRGEFGFSATADRSRFVFQASSFDRPPEIYLAGAAATASSGAIPADVAQLSHFNSDVKPSWGDSVSLTWTNGNFHIQGWLLLPVHYDPTKRYPLLVEVHGGPAAAVLSSWDGGAGGFSATVFSELGYFVLMPNPRGSFGQGEAFTQANRKDFGYGDLRDILDGVHAVLARYPVDPNRIGIAGWSYGGFMSMFAVTQTHRFRAAVAGAGISDWLSYYGENSIDQWMIPYFGASVYDDPAVYAKSSAINYIRNAATPTLIVVGDRDGECPAPQSIEFWHALRDLHVPTQLVVYPNEGHGFSDPADRRDVLQRAVDWFARYMPPGS